MSPLGWQRAGAAAVLVLTGCGPGDVEERPYDARIDCRPETAPVLSTVEAAIAVIDADGDGALTDADVRSGEAAVIIGLSGTHIASGEESEPGFTIHTAWDASLFSWGADFAYWGAEVTCNCLPMLNIFVNFEDETLPSGALPPGDFSGKGIGLDVINLEMHATDGEMDATVRVTSSEGDRATGYLIGSGSSAFLRLIPEEAPTGQRLSVEAFAFREILNEEGD